MGRQITQSAVWAYIAGFLDGDGSIMVQVKNRPLSTMGVRLMFTICFYQDSRHKKPLKWIRKQLGVGYLSDRTDNITELRINGYKQIERILKKVEPYTRFKEKQVKIVIKMLQLIHNKKIAQIERKDRLQLAKLIGKLRNENYFSGTRRYSQKEIEKIIGF